MFTKGWFTAILFFYSFSGVAQSVRFSEFYDLNQGAGGFVDVALVDNERLIAVGSVLNLSDNVNFYNGFHVVVNLNGNQLASQGFNPIGMNYNTRSVIQSTFSEATFSGGYFCDFTVESPGYCDFFFSRINSNTGDTTFTRIIQRTDTADVFLNMIETRPNKIMLIGWTYDDTTDTDADILLITVDTLGNELNRVVYGGGGTDYVHSGIVINEDGEVLMTGGTKSFGGSDYDTWLIKTDSIGNVLWQQTYNGISSGGGGGTAVLKLSDGNYAIVGGVENMSTGNSDALLMKVDAMGDELWVKKYVAPIGSHSFWAGAALEDGSMLAVGQTTNTNDGSQAGWFVKADANGDTLWTRTYNPSDATDLLRNMLVMPNGDIVMVGFGRGENSTTQDGWILRVDSMGCLEEGCWSVGIDDRTIGDLRFAIYPNPASDVVNLQVQGSWFNPSTSLRASVQSVTVTDMLGRQFPLLKGVSRNETGDSVINLNTSALPNGIYLLTITDHEGNLHTQRLVVQH